MLTSATTLPAYQTLLQRAVVPPPLGVTPRNRHTDLAAEAGRLQLDVMLIDISSGAAHGAGDSRHSSRHPNWPTQLSKTGGWAYRKRHPVPLVDHHIICVLVHSEARSTYSSTYPPSTPKQTSNREKKCKNRSGSPAKCGILYSWSYPR